MHNRFLSHIDWILVIALIPLVGAGLVTMHAFVGESNFFDRQIIWVVLAFAAMIGVSFMDFRFLKRTGVLVALFLFSVAVLGLLLLFGSEVKGATSWLSFGGFAVQPADPAKLVLIAILAKYFSRRHIEIAHIRHIFVSGFYAFVPFVLILLQPDFGTAVIIFSIWLGMIMLSGISKKHLTLVFILVLAASTILWNFGFTDIQKNRITSFLHPLTDVQGAGYNAFQSTVAVGSGEVFGKGVGYGTQSRLAFLPEHETDFIFASFAEEWGFVGTFLMLALFGVVIWRILRAAYQGATNFETLFAAGFAIMIVSHMVVHIGMNIGLLPVTGLPLPFVSYGGSHLLTEFIGLGIIMSGRAYARATHRANMDKEIVGLHG